MYVLHITCNVCNHTGMVTDQRVVQRRMRMERINARCTSCKAANSFTVSIAYDNGVNPYETYGLGMYEKDS